MKPSHSGRFDQSFIIHMIRDFFLLLLLLICLELGIRFALVVYDFNRKDKLAAKASAEHLANDLRSIMLNSGGPVAARTVYPILKRNHEKMGLNIAIVPSRVTITSIGKKFGFTPHGIPPKWPAGYNYEFTVNLRAEEFCTKCHIDAKVGDVLGHVVVRSYLSTKLAHWWREVSLTAVLGMGKILLHTIILFFLLKFRMGPLLALRSIISLLSRAGAKLSYRAEVKTHDEFGELAFDLNLFLDRISHIIEDLNGVLDKVIAVNHRLNQVNGQMKAQCQKITHQLQLVTAEAFKNETERAGSSEEGVKAIELTLSLLNELVKDRKSLAEVNKGLHEFLIQYKKTFHQVKGELQRYADVRRILANLSGESFKFSYFLKEFDLLEERMEIIAESGQKLLGRLRDLETTTSKKER